MRGLMISPHAIDRLVEYVPSMSAMTVYELKGWLAEQWAKGVPFGVQRRNGELRLVEVDGLKLALACQRAAGRLTRNRTDSRRATAGTDR